MSTAQAPTPVDDDLDITHVQLLYRVYALFYNKTFGLFLIFATTVLSLLGVLIMQAPKEVRGDPDMYASWLTSVRPKYKGLTSLLDATGMFTMFSSWPFRIVIVLLVLSIIACTVHRLPLLLRNAQHPHLDVRESLFDRARVHRTIEVPGTPVQARETAKAKLAEEGYRLVETSDDTHGVNLYADKFRWFPFGTVLAHLAFCLILLGALITANFGFDDDYFPVPVGTDAVEVGHGTNLSIKANSFTDSYNNDGRPMDYAADVTLYKGGEEVATHVIRVNDPLTYDGVSFNQASFGFALQMLVKDAQGKTLYSGAIPLEYQSADQKKVFGSVELPGQDLTMYAVSNASGVEDEELPAGNVLVQFFGPDKASAAVASEVLSQGQETPVGNYQVTFVRERQFTALMVSKDYGAPYVWAGSILLVLGTICTMFLRHKRIWLRFHPSSGGTQLRLASPDRHDVSYTRSLDAMLTSLNPTATTTDTTKTGDTNHG